MARLTAHDFLLVDGDLPDGFTPLVLAEQAIAQRVWLRLSIHRGEWFMNPNAGLPWADWMNTAMTPGLQAVIEKEIRKQVSTVPGIAAVTSVKTAWNPTTSSIAGVIEARLAEQVFELEFSVSNARYGNAHPRITQRLAKLRAIYPR